ncbi:MAG TPA: hypothetical protein VLT58_19040 [Polyangia bacterium]|nr:hypothetical protein [Polyangia bacterium]
MREQSTGRCIEPHRSRELAQSPAALAWLAIVIVTSLVPALKRVLLHFAH